MTFRNKLIRLAYQHEKIRPELLNILKRADLDTDWSAKKKEISSLKKQLGKKSPANKDELEKQLADAEKEFQRLDDEKATSDPKYKKKKRDERLKELDDGNWDGPLRRAISHLDYVKRQEYVLENGDEIFNRNISQALVKVRKNNEKNPKKWGPLLTYLEDMDGKGVGSYTKPPEGDWGTVLRTLGEIRDVANMGERIKALKSQDVYKEAEKTLAEYNSLKEAEKQDEQDLADGKQRKKDLKKVVSELQKKHDAYKSLAEKMSEYSEPDEVVTIENALKEIGAKLQLFNESLDNKSPTVPKEMLDAAQDFSDSRVKEIQKDVDSFQKSTAKRKSISDQEKRHKAIQKDPIGFFEKEVESKEGAIDDLEKEVSGLRSRIYAERDKEKGLFTWRQKEEAREEARNAAKKLEKLIPELEKARSDLAAVKDEKSQYTQLIQDAYHKLMEKSGDPKKYIAGKKAPLEKSRKKYQTEWESADRMLENRYSDFWAKRANELEAVLKKLDERIQELDSMESSYNEKKGISQKKEPDKSTDKKEPDKQKSDSKGSGEEKPSSNADKRKDFMNQEVTSPYTNNRVKMKTVDEQAREKKDQGVLDKIKGWWDRFMGSSTDKTASVEVKKQFRAFVIRYAYENPEHRKELLPMIDSMGS